MALKKNKQLKQPKKPKTSKKSNTKQRKAPQNQPMSNRPPQNMRPQGNPNEMNRPMNPNMRPPQEIHNNQQPQKQQPNQPQQNMRPTIERGEQSRPPMEKPIQSQAMICESLKTVDGKYLFNQQEFVQWLSGVEGKYFDLKVAILTNGVARVPVNQYIIIREEGKELTPLRSIGRFCMPGVKQQTMNYLAIRDLTYIQNPLAKFELVVVQIPVDKDYIILQNQEFKELRLEKVLVERIFEEGEVMSTSVFKAVEKIGGDDVDVI